MESDNYYNAPPEPKNPFQNIDLTVFKEESKDVFTNVFDSLPNVEKTLIIDRRILSILTFFMSMTEITNAKIDSKIKVLTPDKPPSENVVFVYIIPCDIECFYDIQSHINQHKKERDINFRIPLKEFHILVIPKIDEICYDYVQNSNSRMDFIIHNVYIDAYPMDYDLLSLEEYHALYSLYLDHNISLVSTMARVITKLEETFGKIKYTYFKGNLAKTCYDAIQYEENCSVFLGKEKYEGFLGCFIFDRNIDFVSLLCSQYTYQGMIDEFFNINFNKIKINQDLLSKKKEPPKVEKKEPPKEEPKDDKKGKKKKGKDKDKKEEEEEKKEEEEEKKEVILTIDLSENDRFYYMIKDYHFGKVRNFLPLRLKQHEDISKLAKTSKVLTDVHKSLALYSQAKDERNSLMNHISIAEYLVTIHRKFNYGQCLSFEQQLLTDDDLPPRFKQFIQNLLWSHRGIFNLIRLLSIESITHGGLGKYYEEFRKEFLQIYGYQQIIFLRNLEKLKILYGKDKEAMNYFYIFQQLNLLSEKLNVDNPDSPSYVFNGLCPIIVRLLENAVTKGWGSMIQILSKIPGAFSEPYSEPEEKNMFKPQQDRDNAVLVVFIGGITYAEVSAIRLLGKKLGINFIILTSHFITTKRLFEELGATNKIESEYTNSKFIADYVELMEERSKKSSSSK